jgi:F-type H+-transporting ATPase subunit gamma
LTKSSPLHKFTGLPGNPGSSASEHAADAGDEKRHRRANELVDVLQLDYNKTRQQLITNEMLDIAGGAEALAQGD